MLNTVALTLKSTGTPAPVRRRIEELFIREAGQSSYPGWVLYPQDSRQFSGSPFLLGRAGEVENVISQPRDAEQVRVIRIGQQACMLGVGSVDRVEAFSDSR